MFASIDFSTTSLASRLLEDRKCCVGVSADAENALNELLHSDIMNLDLAQIKTVQNCDSEFTNNLNLLEVYLAGLFSNIQGEIIYSF